VQSASIIRRLLQKEETLVTEQPSASLESEISIDNECRTRMLRPLCAGELDYNRLLAFFHLPTKNPQNFVVSKVKKPLAG
jgi:hypothetical protein